MSYTYIASLAECCTYLKGLLYLKKDQVCLGEGAERIVFSSSAITSSGNNGEYKIDVFCEEADNNNIKLCVVCITLKI